MLYALWRSAPYGLIDLELDKNIDTMLRLASDVNPLIRMNLANTCKPFNVKECRSGVGLARKFWKIHIVNWRCKVQLIKARATTQFIKGKKLYPAYLNIYIAPDEHCNSRPCWKVFRHSRSMRCGLSDAYAPIGKRIAANGWLPSQKNPISFAAKCWLYSENIIPNLWIIMNLFFVDGKTSPLLKAQIYRSRFAAIHDEAFGFYTRPFVPIHRFRLRWQHGILENNSWPLLRWLRWDWIHSARFAVTARILFKCGKVSHQRKRHGDVQTV